MKVRLLVGSLMFSWRIVFAQCGGSLISYFPSTVNGVAVSQAYSGGVIDTGSTYTTCGVASGPTLLGGSMPTAFTHTLSFTSPVNNVMYVLCGADSVPTYAETFTFSVNQGNLSVSQSGSNCLFTQSGSVLNANSSGATSNSAYITLTSTQSYTSIIVSGNGGNNGTFMALCSNSIGIEEKANNRPLAIYPNPNEGRFVLRGLRPDAQTMRIEIRDLSGAILGHYNSPLMKNGEVDLNLNLANGIYLVRVIEEEAEAKVVKVVVCK